MWDVAFEHETDVATEGESVARIRRLTVDELDPEMAAPEGGLVAEREGTAAKESGLAAEWGEICPQGDPKEVQEGGVCVMLGESDGPKVTPPPPAAV